MFKRTFSEQLKLENKPTIEELKKLPTKRILAFFKKHRGMRYIGICQCCGERFADNVEEKQFQVDAENYIENIKKLLDTKEHVV